MLRSEKERKYVASDGVSFTRNGGTGDVMPNSRNRCIIVSTGSSSPP